MNSHSNDRKVLCDIARWSFRTVNTLLDRDQRFARDLRSDHTQSRQIIREETINAELAITLREQFPNQVDIILFTSHEEKKSGADWYWRIETQGRAVHARVQAKRVQRSEFGEDDQDGDVDFDLNQLHRLVEATNQAKQQLPGLQAWLATYARFRATPPCGLDDLRRCPRHMHADGCDTHEPSLWIAQAEEIANHIKPSLATAEIVEMSLRLDCLLPCIDSPAVAPGPPSKGFTLSDSLMTYQECLTAIDQVPELRREFRGALRIAV